MPKVLFIVNHRKDRSPGQRYRFEQYMSLLEQNGFSCALSPLLINAEEDKAFYSPGNYLAKLSLFIKAFYRRLKDVFRAKDFDIIFVFREAMMTGTTFFEKQFKKSGAKIIFDFDDAIWKHDVSEGNKKLAWLKRPEKTNELMAMADLVFAGNQYLADYAFQFNKSVAIVPSTIDLNYYRLPSKKFTETAPVIIGWSGSLTTIEHFKLIVPVFRKLKEKYGNQVAFKVLGVPEYKNEELGIDGIKWTPETEVAEISSFDIGVMPLPDNEWSKGKCGMKGLQYMALEVATVMSAVGVNNHIIQNGENGFLASSDEEWIAKISLLINSKELREKMGKAGRETVAKSYSLQAIQQDYLTYFMKLAPAN